MDSKVQIWHNGKCSKSNQAKQWLENKSIEFVVVDYINEEIQIDAFENLVEKLQIHPFDLIRKNEFNFDASWQKEDKSEKEWMVLMMNQPNLIQRPIVVKDNRAIVARPIEKIEILF